MEEEIKSSNLLLEEGKWHNFWQEVILPKKIQVKIPVSKKKVLILSGPTAIGKTALSLILAEKLGGEIVSADSMQVYKGMDIGTAKASVEERRLIPHHLIDIRTVKDKFNIVDFWHAATAAIEDISLRGKVPIIVGGTGFYLSALLEGPPAGPASVESVRESLEKEWEEKGAFHLFNQVEHFDPQYAHTITHNDRQKIIRALEIITLTGCKVSDFSNKEKKEVVYDARCWFLHEAKELLYPKIEDRCEKMLTEGLIDEVLRLDKEGLRENSSAAQAIGYRQCLNYLDSMQTKEDLSQFISSFKQASRRYAKRQFTWFRKQPLFHWLDREKLSLDAIVETILQDFTWK